MMRLVGRPINHGLLSSIFIFYFFDRKKDVY